MKAAEELRIYAAEAKTKPDYTLTAPALLDRCREFYQDPENVKRFEEWKKKRGEQNEKTAV